MWQQSSFSFLIASKCWNAFYFFMLSLKDLLAQSNLLFQFQSLRGKLNIATTYGLKTKIIFPIQNSQWLNSIVENVRLVHLRHHQTDLVTHKKPFSNIICHKCEKQHCRNIHAYILTTHNNTSPLHHYVLVAMLLYQYVPDHQFDFK